MTQKQTKPRPAAGEKLPAQYINYVFFKLDLMWRRLPEEKRGQGKQREFLRTVEEHKGPMLLRSFSLMGLRGDAGFIALEDRPRQVCTFERFDSYGGEQRETRDPGIWLKMAGF